MRKICLLFSTCPFEPWLRLVSYDHELLIGLLGGYWWFGVV